ncbi:hypothetical protein DU002_06305 [Corallincola holothuriorum]|uniref:Uncharacterized protein n=1 Tax=Corallincola holothuriorum TaxID=2282215 RepID=A0A368NM05_9GAMM|nr:hypothetical protein [Corallincola holothuriorum]RCU50933.1 hypothetical protein DU002_06305 [Corallincola holothuriorum]
MKLLSCLIAILLTLWLLFSRTDSYLISGSDAIDLTYKFPLSVVVILTVLTWIFGVALLAVKHKSKQLIAPTVIIAATLLLTSQALVNSGKRQQLEYYVAGIPISTIQYDPSADHTILVSAQFGLLSSITMQQQSMTIATGICPLCMNLSDLEQD